MFFFNEYGNRKGTVLITLVKVANGVMKLIEKFIYPVVCLDSDCHVILLLKASARFCFQELMMAYFYAHEPMP